MPNPIPALMPSPGTTAKPGINAKDADNAITGTSFQKVVDQQSSAQENNLGTTEGTAKEHDAASEPEIADAEDVDLVVPVSPEDKTPREIPSSLPETLHKQIAKPQNEDLPVKASTFTTKTKAVVDDRPVAPHTETSQSQQHRAQSEAGPTAQPHKFRSATQREAQEVTPDHRASPRYCQHLMHNRKKPPISFCRSGPRGTHQPSRIYLRRRARKQ